MSFTPNEIKNKEFSRTKNGLEPTEVADYLSQLSQEIEHLKEQKKQLETVVEEKENNLKAYKEVQQSVSDALVQAQAASQETKAAATKEAAAIVDKAKAEADRIVNDGVEKARRLSFQTEDMKRQSKIFRSRFRMLVEAQLDLLKNDDWDYLLNYDLDAQQVTEENFQHLQQNDLTKQEKQQQAAAQQAEAQEGSKPAKEAENKKENK